MSVPVPSGFAFPSSHSTREFRFLFAATVLAFTVALVAAPDFLVRLCLLGGALTGYFLWKTWVQEVADAATQAGVPAPGMGADRPSASAQTPASEPLEAIESHAWIALAEASARAKRLRLTTLRPTTADGRDLQDRLAAAVQAAEARVEETVAARIQAALDAERARVAQESKGARERQQQAIEQATVSARTQAEADSLSELEIAVAAAEARVRVEVQSQADAQAAHLAAERDAAERLAIEAAQAEVAQEAEECLRAVQDAAQAEVASTKREAQEQRKAEREALAAVRAEADARCERVQAEAQQELEAERAAAQRQVQENEAAQEAALAAQRQALDREQEDRIADLRAGWQAEREALLSELYVLGEKVEGLAISQSEWHQQAERTKELLETAWQSWEPDPQDRAAWADGSSRWKDLQNQSIEAVQEFIALLGEGALALQAMHGQLSANQNACQGMQGYLDVLTRFSDQARLLAFNGTIEAAGAGDAGLGFARVARDVRDLAQDSSVKGTEALNDWATASDSVMAIGRTAGDLQRVLHYLGETSERLRSGLQDQGAQASTLVKQTCAYKESTAELSRALQVAMESGQVQSVLARNLSETIRELRGAVQQLARVEGEQPDAEQTQLEEAGPEPNTACEAVDTEDETSLREVAEPESKEPAAEQETGEVEAHVDEVCPGDTGELQTVQGESKEGEPGATEFSEIEAGASDPDSEEPGSGPNLRLVA